MIDGIHGIQQIAAIDPGYARMDAATIARSFISRNAATFEQIKVRRGNGVGKRIGVVESVGRIDKQLTLKNRESFNRLAANESCGEIIHYISSPGGSTSGIDDLNRTIERAAKVKRVTAFIEDIGASGGYYIAAPATEIVANPTAVVGSIGTFCVLIDASRMLKEKGIDVIVVRAGAKKGIGEYGAAITSEEIASVQAHVDEVNRHFLAAIMRGRKLDPRRVADIADGRVFVGQQAVAVGLVDRIALFEDVLAEVVARNTDGLGYLMGIEARNLTRLKKGFNYENPSDPQGQVLDKSLPEFAEPFAIVKVAHSPGDSENPPMPANDRYQLVDRISRDTANFSVGTPVQLATPIETSYWLRMLHTIPGIEVSASHGARHAMALNHWAGAEPSNVQPEVDYSTLRATICVESDAYCEGVYPDALVVDEAAQIPANMALEVLTIHLDEDDYRLDFLPANTIVGLEDGVPVKAAFGGVLCDDRPFLRDVARMAYEWYKVDRRQLTVTFRQVRNLFDLGLLITTIGSGSTIETINTVLSAITFNLKNGTMKVETADDQLDLRSVVA